jgi:cytochrome c-type protein NapB
MSRGATGLVLPVFLVASMSIAVAAVIVAVKQVPARPPAQPEPPAVPVLVAPSEPIPAEAQVFRTPPSSMAIKPEMRRHRVAHERTLETWRYLRAYPGAPPRIPHGLTPDEYRNDGCKTCHERGGYSERFAAYVPLTPHPEMPMCLQCHVGDDRITGISSPSSDPNSRCRQCHTPAGPPRTDFNAALNWATTTWPQPTRRRTNGSPPTIPHELDSRGNCLTCHAGPAAVEEIRTSHAKWSACRQCHVTIDRQATEFTRAAPGRVRQGGVP